MLGQSKQTALIGPWERGFWNARSPIQHEPSYTTQHLFNAITFNSIILGLKANSQACHGPKSMCVCVSQLFSSRTHILLETPIWLLYAHLNMMVKLWAIVHPIGYCTPGSFAGLLILNLARDSAKLSAALRSHSQSLAMLFKEPASCLG